MNKVEKALAADDVGPIDIVEILAKNNDWDFDRLDEDQIQMEIEANWRIYGLDLSWNSFEESLRLACSFELSVPKDKITKLVKLLNLVNIKCWTGSFVFSEESTLMIFKYGLNLTGGSFTSALQINSILETSILACETYYPAFQLVCWGDETPSEALAVAFDKSYGTA